MRETPTVIIGAGLAGLAAACTLQAAGHTPWIVEANERPGGRVETLHDEAGRAVADLGPNWVWPPFQPGIARWLERLDVAVMEQFERGDAVLDGFSDTPVRQPLPGQHGMVRIAGGVGEIVRAMVARLPAEAIRQQAPVTEVALTDRSKLLVRIGNDETILADQVVMAAPLRLIAERIRLPRELPPALIETLSATPTWMAAQAKAVIRYERPFWRDHGLSGRIASRQGPLFEAHDHTSAAGDPALFGFISTPPGHRDPALLEKAIIHQLERCFGPAAREVSALHIRDWADARWICSAADREGLPAHPTPGPEILRQGHLADRLWFCAAETSTQSPGLIEGALLAGERAGKAVLATMAAAHSGSDCA